MQGQEQPPFFGIFRSLRQVHSLGAGLYGITFSYHLISFLFMDEYMGIVKLFAGPFAPKGWAFCDGSLMQISQNAALYSLLSTTYGGDGRSTFALPDLRGRAALGAGNGNGVPPVTPGQVGGAASVTLSTAQLPTHTHAQLVSTQGATAEAPTGGEALAVPNGLTANGESVTIQAFGAASNLTPLSPATIGTAGNGQPVSLMPPFLGMNYIICVEGMYPPRN